MVILVRYSSPPRVDQALPALDPYEAHSEINESGDGAICSEKVSHQPGLLPPGFRNSSLKMKKWIIIAFANKTDRQIDKHVHTALDTPRHATPSSNREARGLPARIWGRDRVTGAAGECAPATGIEK